MGEKEKIDISVIVPVVERYDNLHKLHSEFSSAFDKLGKSYEFIFVVDGEFDKVFADLKKLKSENSNIQIIKLAKNFGESVAITIGNEKAHGSYLFTLASYFQVVPEVVSDIWNELSSGYDLVLTRRYPRIDSMINRIQSFVFHWLIRKVSKCYCTREYNIGY